MMEIENLISDVYNSRRSALAAVGPSSRKDGNIPEDFKLKFVVAWSRIGRGKDKNESEEPGT
ncbi:MAG: hypothetical protein K9K64_06910 [Desulfohalobiaceae bacterium]|nr:hypothetical protein [Desulfohalobiaceae bacterium]